MQPRHTLRSTTTRQLAYHLTLPDPRNGPSVSLTGQVCHPIAGGCAVRTTARLLTAGEGRRVCVLRGLAHLCDPDMAIFSRRL